MASSGESPVKDARAAQKLNLSSSPHRKKRINSEDAEATGFCGALQRAPPPVPPALLRRIGVKEVTGVGKMFITSLIVRNDTKIPSSTPVINHNRAVNLSDYSPPSFSASYLLNPIINYLPMFNSPAVVNLTEKGNPDGADTRKSVNFEGRSLNKPFIFEQPGKRRQQDNYPLVNNGNRDVIGSFNPRFGFLLNLNGNSSAQSKVSSVVKNELTDTNDKPNFVIIVQDQNQLENSQNSESLTGPVNLEPNRDISENAINSRISLSTKEKGEIVEMIRSMENMRLSPIATQLLNSYMESDSKSSMLSIQSAVINPPSNTIQNSSTDNPYKLNQPVLDEVKQENPKNVINNERNKQVQPVKNLAQESVVLPEKKSPETSTENVKSTNVLQNAGDSFAAEIVKSTENSSSSITSSASSIANSEIQPNTLSLRSTDSAFPPQSIISKPRNDFVNDQSGFIVMIPHQAEMDQNQLIKSLNQVLDNDNVKIFPVNANQIPSCNDSNVDAVSEVSLTLNNSNVNSQLETVIGSSDIVEKVQPSKVTSKQFQSVKKDLTLKFPESQPLNLEENTPSSPITGKQTNSTGESDSASNGNNSTNVFVSFQNETTGNTGALNVAQSNEKREETETVTSSSEASLLSSKTNSSDSEFTGNNSANIFLPFQNEFAGALDIVQSNKQIEEAENVISSSEAPLLSSRLSSQVLKNTSNIPLQNENNASTAAATQILRNDNVVTTSPNTDQKKVEENDQDLKRNSTVEVPTLDSKSQLDVVGDLQDNKTDSVQLSSSLKNDSFSSQLSGGSVSGNVIAPFENNTLDTRKESVNDSLIDKPIKDDNLENRASIPNNEKDKEEVTKPITEQSTTISNEKVSSTSSPEVTVPATTVIPTKSSSVVDDNSKTESELESSNLPSRIAPFVVPPPNKIVNNPKMSDIISGKVFTTSDLKGDQIQKKDKTNEEPTKQKTVKNDPIAPVSTTTKKPAPKTASIEKPTESTTSKIEPTKLSSIFEGPQIQDDFPFIHFPPKVIIPSHRRPIPPFGFGPMPIFPISGPTINKDSDILRNRYNSFDVPLKEPDITYNLHNLPVYNLPPRIYFPSTLKTASKNPFPPVVPLIGRNFNYPVY